MINRRGSLAVATLLAVSACGKDPPPPPPVLQLSISSSADLNPAADASPRPVSVRLYQLSATQKFDKADVFALTEREQATLGSDDLGAGDFVVKPSAKQDMTQELKPGTQAVGVVALFYSIDNAQWRASAPVAASGPTKLVLDIQKLSVSLKPPAK